MKRVFALAGLLLAVGLALKLAFKPPTERPPANPDVRETDRAPALSANEERILSRYPDRGDRAFARHVFEKYRGTAEAIERTDGLRGLRLLDALDLEAVYLYEKHPRDFAKLRESLSDAAAARLLLHWREYFGAKRGDDGDRELFIEETARLGARQRKFAARFPAALPLVLADPDGMADLADHFSDDPQALGDAIAILSLVSLETGSTDLRAALATIENDPARAIEAFRIRGLEGFGLVALYSHVLLAVGDALPFDQSLILLRVNTDDVDVMLRSFSPERVAAVLKRVASTGLVSQAGTSPHGLRLILEEGELGEQALRHGGPDAADLAFALFSDRALRRQALAAIADHGPEALLILDKYASSSEFREILRAHGSAIIPPIAAADCAPETLAYLRAKGEKSFRENLAQGMLALSGENGQAVIGVIYRDGIDRAMELSRTDMRFEEFLPLYDLVHLAKVVSRGQSPTGGEAAWGMIDAAFVITDALSLLAFQPEGAAAAEAARAELRSGVKAASKQAGGELAESAAEAAAKAAAKAGETAAGRAARWWTVRSAGGAFAVLSRLPQALEKLSFAEVVKMGEPICAKAGLKLTRWTPPRLVAASLKGAADFPVKRTVKYFAAQAASASVGFVGMKKMEEYLASRRLDGGAEE